MSDKERLRSSMSPKRAVVVVVILAVSAWIAVKALESPDPPDFTASGDPVELPQPGQFPAASLSEFEGILVGQRGRPVVVNIWASWCAPCRTEMPLLQQAADNYTPDVVILGVASNDDPREARAFLDEFGLTYPNVFDESGDIRVALGLTAYPTTYLFDRDGTIAARVDGGISEQRLAALIEDLLR